jgi:hypothetical protein
MTAPRAKLRAQILRFVCVAPSSKRAAVRRIDSRVSVFETAASRPKNGASHPK